MGIFASEIPRLFPDFVLPNFKFSLTKKRQMQVKCNNILM